MIRSQIRDAAVSTAKTYGHEEVELRHVWYALARRFRDQPDLEPLFAAAKEALEPRGTAIAAPLMSREAVQLLQTVTSERQALDLLKERLGSPQTDVSDRTGATVQHEESVDQAESVEPSPDTLRTDPEETVPDILAELDSLIGLEAVKAQVKSLIAVVQANAEREKAGLKPVNPSLHLVFTGPPGTGKTTVARLVARLYAATGALPTANFTEAGRADLIAGYVGQTALKTRDVIDRTRPGVLFVDEAYALTPHSDVDFGREAVATLVKAMEDHRDSLAVIVAGYEEEMAQFVNSNPGLRSRLKTYIGFPNYNPRELTQIFQLFARETGISLAEGVAGRAEDLFARTADKKAFGNARFARSLFEHAYANMAARAAEDGVITVDELVQLKPEDIDMELDDLIQERLRIGF